MKIIGNTLETIHTFRHSYVSERMVIDPFLSAKSALAASQNAKLQLLYLDVNDTFYLVENTTAIAHYLQYDEAAVLIREWSPADFIAQMRSYDRPGFDNYFQLLVQNTAEAVSEQDAHNVTKA